MTDKAIKLYHSAGSPNSRRVRIFLDEKGLSIPLVAVDLGKGEQHSQAYRAINPRRVVPTLVLEDGTAIGEVPAIMRYIEEIHPQTPLLGETTKERALVTMWERRVELEGFAAVMEAIRNTASGLKGRAIAGPYDYEQIPELAERSKQRVKNFFADLDTRLGEVAFVAGGALFNRRHHGVGHGRFRRQGDQLPPAGRAHSTKALVQLGVEASERVSLVSIASLRGDPLYRISGSNNAFNALHNGGKLICVGARTKAAW
jgi:glutathione S-transferase